MNRSRYFLNKESHAAGSMQIWGDLIGHTAPSHRSGRNFFRDGILSRCLVYVFLIGLLFFPACKSDQTIPKEISPSVTPQEKATVTPEEESELTTLGLVIDEKFQPVVNAAVGENQLLTDHNGVVTGTLVPNQAGLIPVEAAGYVTGYGTGTAISDGYQVMIVQLSSIDPLMPIAADQQAVITLGEPEEPTLQAHVSNLTMSEEGAMLQLTEINPINMSEPWITDAGTDLNLLYGFSISALDRWGDTLPVETSSEILIANQGGDVSQMVLAYFQGF